MAKTICRSLRNVSLGSAALLALLAAPAAARDSLTGVILRGRAVAERAGERGPPLLTPGVRVVSPAGSWTEIAFSDGSSVVLEAGADFTLRGIERDPRSGRLVVRAAAGGGRLRVSASEEVDFVIVTQGAELRLRGAAAVLDSGPAGSVTLTAGRSVTVQRADGREEVLRRPGFTLALREGGARREAREQLAVAVAPFAPVRTSAAPDRAAPDGLRQFAVVQDIRRDGSNTVAVPQPTSPSFRGGGNTVAAAQPGSFRGGTSTVAESLPPRGGSALALALAGFDTRATAGANITSPGTNTPTASLNAQFILPNPPTPEFTGGVGLDLFGTARVRRFDPAASGATPGRADSGLVDLNGQQKVASARFVNIAGASVPPGSGTTFYDAVANVGVVTLTTFAPLTDNESTNFRDNVAPKAAADSPTGLQRDFSGVDYRINQLFQERKTTNISVSGANTPSVRFDKVNQNPTSFTGSAVLENQLRSSATLGTVEPLQGASGLIMVRATQPLPLSNQPNAGDPNGCIAAANCTIYPWPASAGFTEPTQRGQFPTSVFIVDKVTEGSEQLLAERGIRPGERYFVIGGTPLPAGPGGTLPGPGGVTRFAVSDGLNPLPSGGFATGQSIEAQFRGPGRADQPAAFNRFNGFRPEETFIPGAARGDTHLIVIAGEDGRNPAYRADLQVDAEGRSSASVATGAIARLPAGTDPAQSLALSGQVVGATRRDVALGSSAIASNLGSLGTDATGAGAHVFGGSERAPGEVGFFAVGQADTRRGLPGTGAGVQPGQVDNPGGTASPFAFTRLATNVGAPAQGTGPGRLDGLRGFAAGLVETTQPGSSAIGVHAGVGAELGDVAVQGRNGDAAHREFDATIRLAARAAGEISAAPPAAPPPAGRADRTLAFGADANGLPTTAVGARGSFAAVIPGQASMASVDPDLVRGLPGNMPASNEHLAWGYFLGDLVAATPGGSREFAGLGFWVAGRPVALDALQGLSGSATYRGGMIGNVADAGGLRTRTGDFAHSVDFGARRGSFEANFDGAGFRVGTGLSGATFDGAGVGGAGRVMSVRGGFFHNGPLNGGAPAATGGVFGIAGPGYGANGIFVGGR